MTRARFLGGLGSSISNALLFGAIVAAWPGLPSGYYPYEGKIPAHEGTYFPRLAAWRPYVDNPDRGWPKQAPTCPDAALHGAEPRLLWAPLPDDYYPWRSSSEAPLFACVRLAPDGMVLAVRLLGSGGGRGIDRELVETIRSRWVVAEPQEPGRSQRVRLSAAFPPL